MKYFSGTATAATRSFLFALVTGVSTAALSAQALAQQPGQPAGNQEQVVAFDIAPQPLSSALSEFARQAGVRALYPSEQLRTINSPGLHGSFTREEGLSRLMENSGHRARINYDDVIELETREGPQDDRADAAEQAGVGATMEEKEIVVVGTNIRGVYPSSSPVEIYSADDVARTGATTMEQFVQKLPQNLSTRTEFAPGAASVSGTSSINAIDLRGLGVGTTLVLMNGRRLALAGSGQAADVSMIPLSAVKRVEILSDGASAIYGSEAIGGVVNFVLVDDLDGAETVLRYAGVTDGGMRQGSLNQSFGRSWGSGNGIIAYSYHSASALDRRDRAYAASAGRGDLSPEDQRQNALLTLSQDLGDQLTLGADLAVASRSIKNEFIVAGTTTASYNQSEAMQYVANVEVDYEIKPSLTALLLATYASVDTDGINEFRFANAPWSRASADTNYEALDVTFRVDGRAAVLQGGDLRFSLGGGRTEEQLIASTERVLGRDTTYAYGELFAPIIGDSQDIPLAHRIEVSVAARYTAYDDASAPSTGQEFGGDISPKVGLLWAPTDYLSLRGTYGESFRAAALTELDPTFAINQLITFPILGVPTRLLTVRGPALVEPETAQSYTIGFDVAPRGLPTLRIAGTYFDIDYTDRIANPDPAGRAIFAPADFPDALFHTDSVAYIEEILRTTPNFTNTLGVDLNDPHAAAMQLAGFSDLLVYDRRLRNLARSKMDGVDLSARYTFDNAWGTFSVGGQITYIFDYAEQVSDNSPVITAVDTVLRPVDLRGRAYASLARGRLETSLNVQYVDDYRNPFVAGQRAVDSWTTLDWTASYSFGSDERAVEGRVSVQNLFDEDPPFVASSGVANLGLTAPVGFDPANANPLGRFIAVQVSKRW
jgi:outer membrane receptor protein involved in Fe transport